MQGPDEIRARLARLTPGQADCLRLVAEQLSSKEIAVKLGISPHTVDQRFKAACRTLNVSTRRDAARLFSQYQHLVYQSPDIDTRREISPLGLAVQPITQRAGDAREGSREGRFSLHYVAIPLPTRGREFNELTATQRFAWAFTIAFAGIVASLIVITTLDALGRLILQGQSQPTLQQAPKGEHGDVMSRTRQQAGQKIVDALIPAEVAIDQAFASCATLAAILPDARISAAISAEHSQSIIARSSRLVSAMADVRSEAVAIHADLVELSHSLGIDPLSFGGLMGKPKLLRSNVLSLASAG